MNTPFFTVIIPVFNKEKHVKESIESVLSQTYCNFELIVVNDSSTDNSMSVVGEFSDERLKVLTRPKPGPGGYAARNLGIRSSSGKWIRFLDADDTWSCNHLQCMKELIESYPTHGLFSCDWKVEGSENASLGEGFFMGRKEVFMNPNDYLKSCIDGSRPINTNVVCVSRSLIKDRDVFPEGKTDRTGDVHTWVRLVIMASGLVVGSFIGAQRNLGTENRVSGNSKPNPDFFIDGFFSEPSFDVDKRLLNIYKNRLVGYALKESDFEGALSKGRLASLNYRNDFKYSIKILFFAFLPLSFFCFIRRLKRSSFLSGPKQ